MDSPNKELTFRVKRNVLTAKLGAAAPEPKTEIKELKVTPQPAPGLSVYGEDVEIGEIEGLSNVGRYTTMGVSNPVSAAAKAGLKTGDEIVTVNGKAVKSWESLQELVQFELRHGAKNLSLGIVTHPLSYWTPESHPLPATRASQTIELPAKPLEQLGIYSSEMFIASLLSDSPAQTAGFAAGDRLVAIDGKVPQSFPDLREMVQKAGEAKGNFELTVERDGKLLRKEITPKSSVVRDPTGHENRQYMMGVYPLFVQSEPDVYVERIFNPFTLTVEAWSRALDLSGKTLVSIKKLFLREVSVGTLGGPILIGKLAGDSMSRGVSAFLKVMALISISLAIFNILPVPILDGGHIFLLLVEVIRGKPITMKQTEFVQQVGLSLIVLLLVVVLFNDISRVGIPALRNMFQ
jgi:regulator of sigma E protease